MFGKSICYLLNNFILEDVCTVTVQQCSRYMMFENEMRSNLQGLEMYLNDCYLIMAITQEIELSGEVHTAGIVNQMLHEISY